MKIFKKRTFTEKIRLRIFGLWCLAAAMLVYMIVVGEMGLGDSRVISRFADTAGTLIFFGGLGWVVSKIIRNKKLLKSTQMLREQLRQETDERNRYLHDKSGGIVWDALFILLLFITMTASLVNMPAFYTSFAVLAAAVGLKIAAYLFYSKTE